MNYQIQPGYFESAYGAVLKAWERKQAGKPPVKEVTPKNFWRDFFSSLSTSKTYTYYELAELSGRRFETVRNYVSDHPKQFIRKGRMGKKSLVRIKP